MAETIERNATPAQSAPQPGLMAHVRESFRVNRYALSTERNYCHWIWRFVLFHHKRSPREMGAAEVEAFLSHLATQREVSAGTQNQELAGAIAGSGDSGYPSLVAKTDATGIGVPNGAAKGRREFSSRLFYCLGVLSNGRPVVTRGAIVGVQGGKDDAAARGWEPRVIKG